MKREKVLSIRAILPLLLLPIALVVALPACKDKEKQEEAPKEEINPYALEDERARLAARCATQYPDAQVLADGSFYQRLYASGSGEAISERQWLYIDYTTLTFDGGFIVSSIAADAYQYGRQSKTQRYVSVPRKNSAQEGLGEALHEIINQFEVGDTVLIGFSGSAGNSTRLWQGRSFIPVLCRMVVVAAYESPEEAEREQIEAFAKAHTDLSLQDGYYIKQNKAGDGPVIAAEGAVSIRYAACFLDGAMLETNDREYAEEYNVNFPRELDKPLVLKVTEPEGMIAGFDGLFTDLNEGADFEVIIPSDKAYGAAGKGSVRPYEPLHFKLKVEKYIPPKEEK